MTLFQLHTKKGTKITLPSSDILMVSDTGSNLEIKRYSTSVNLVVTDSINVFQGNGFLLTSYKGSNIAINCTYCTFLQSDKDSNKTKVTLDGESILVDDSQDSILSKVNPPNSSANIVGEIKGWSTSIAPEGWLICDGTSLDRVSYPDLYNLIGDTFTEVPSMDKFNIPNLSDKVLVGSGILPIGSKGGAKDTTLSISNLPAHSHAVACNDLPGNSADPTNRLLANAGSFDNEFTDQVGNASMNASMVGDTGSGESFTNMQPYAVLNYIIYTGI